MEINFDNLKEDQVIKLSAAVILGTGNIQLYKDIPYMKSHSNTNDTLIYCGKVPNFSPYALRLSEFGEINVDIDKQKMIFWSDSLEKALRRLIKYENEKSAIVDEKLHRFKNIKKFSTKIRESAKILLDEFKDENVLTKENKEETNIKESNMAELTIKEFTAKEVRKISKDNQKLNYYVQDQIDEVKEKILKAAHQGNFSIYHKFSPYFEQRTEEITSYFEDLGFKFLFIESSEKIYDEQDVEISWK